MIVVRHPEHSDYWDVDFTADLASGETLTGVPTHEAAGLTLTPAGIIESTKARVQITGGLHGKLHQVQTKAVTTSSRTLVHVWPYMAFNG